MSELSSTDRTAESLRRRNLRDATLAVFLRFGLRWASTDPGARAANVS